MSARITAEEIARKICEAEGSPTAMPAPTPEQAAVIDAPLRPALVVAGAGSGKTETMAARVVALIANGVPPERILGLTFTRKAAAELAERVRRRLRQLRRAGLIQADEFAGLGQPVIATYNSYAAQLVREYGLRLGVDPDAALLTEATRWGIASRVVAASAGLPEDMNYAADTLAGALLAMSDQVTEHLLDPAGVLGEIERMCEVFADPPPSGRKRALQLQSKKFAKQLRLRLELARMLPAYAEAKREAGVVEFSDQVALAARLAGHADVREAERARFDAVMLDEYQDTSAAQLMMLKSLYDEDFPVMAVGDPHQSIYGWRGAAAGTLAQFPADFPWRGQDSPVLTLSVAWRNDEKILEAANRISRPLRLGTRIVLPELRPRPQAGAGRVEAAFFRAQSEEAAAIAGLLADEWRPGPTGERPTAAVLCRKRSQFDSVAAALQAAGLPYEVVGLGGLLHVPEVSDIVSFLSAAHDPSRGDALMRLLTGPRYGLAPADLLGLGAWARQRAREGAPGSGHSGSSRELAEVTLDDVDGASIVDAIDELPPPGWRGASKLTLSATGREQCARLAGDLASLRRHAYLPPAELVALAARILGLDIELQARSGRAGLGNVERLQDAARGFSEVGEDGYATLGAFLAYLQAAEQRDERMEVASGEIDAERIQILTIHAAKGLEWDIVCLPGLTEGNLPSLKAGKNPDEGPVSLGWAGRDGGLPYHLRQDAMYLPGLELQAGMDVVCLEDELGVFCLTCAQHELDEDRRLAYVAVTRARRLLFASGSWFHGRAKETQQPSEFLQQIAASPGIGGEEPGPGEENPDIDAWRSASWPSDPLGNRREAFEAARTVVEKAQAELAGSAQDAADGGLSGRARLLLADRRAPGRAQAPATLRHVTGSGVGSLAGDLEGYVLALRRPRPPAPSPWARDGVAFHEWAERFLGQPSLFAEEELESPDEQWIAEGAGLEDLKRNFERCEWVARPERWRLMSAERDVETPLGPVMLRCRADAIFEDLAHPGRIEIVDWKTGKPPASERARRSVFHQLAAYRIAFSRLLGIDPENVSTALYYVARDVTIRPSGQELPTLQDLTGALGLLQEAGIRVLARD